MKKVSELIREYPEGSTVLYKPFSELSHSEQWGWNGEKNWCKSAVILEWMDKDAVKVLQENGYERCVSPSIISSFVPEYPIGQIVKIKSESVTLKPHNGKEMKISDYRWIDGEFTYSLFLIEENRGVCTAEKEHFFVV